MASWGLLGFEHRTTPRPLLEDALPITARGVLGGDRGCQYLGWRFVTGRLVIFFLPRIVDACDRPDRALGCAYAALIILVLVLFLSVGAEIQ